MKVSTREHYDRLIAEGNDPLKDEEVMRKYMQRWEGANFIDLLDLSEKKRVLEIGVGTGRIAQRVLQNDYKEFVGLDLSPKTIVRARDNLNEFKNVKLIEGNIENFVRENYFDVIYSVLTFMHIKSKTKAIANIISSLKVEGIVVLSISKQDKWLDYGNRKVRLYPASIEDYAGWFEEVNCKINLTKEIVDTFIFPDGKKSDTYGKEIAFIIKVTKIE